MTIHPKPEMLLLPSQSGYNIMQGRTPILFCMLLMTKLKSSDVGQIISNKSNGNLPGRKDQIQSNPLKDTRRRWKLEMGHGNNGTSGVHDSHAKGRLGKNALKGF